MRPDLIAVQSGTAFDQTWWLTGVLISAIGRGFMTPAPSSLSAVARGRRPEGPASQRCLAADLPDHDHPTGDHRLRRRARAAQGNPEQRHPADARRRRVTCLADPRHRRRGGRVRDSSRRPLAIGISTLVAQNVVPATSDRAAVRLNHVDRRRRRDDPARPGHRPPDLMEKSALAHLQRAVAARSGVPPPCGAGDRAERSADNSYTPVRSRAERT